MMTNEQTAEARPHEKEPPPEPVPNPASWWESPTDGDDQEGEEAGYGYGV